MMTIMYVGIVVEFISIEGWAFVQTLLAGQFFQLRLRAKSKIYGETITFHMM